MNMLIFKVRFTELQAVSAVETKGEKFESYWVTSYKLQTSMDCVSYCDLQDANQNVLVMLWASSLYGSLNT